MMSMHNEIDIPDQASTRELKTHSFLDTMGDNQVNTQLYLENKAKIASANIRKLLDQKVPRLNFM